MASSCVTIFLTVTPASRKQNLEWNLKPCEQIVGSSKRERWHQNSFSARLKRFHKLQTLFYTPAKKSGMLHLWFYSGISGGYELPSPKCFWAITPHTNISLWAFPFLFSQRRNAWPPWTWFLATVSSFLRKVCCCPATPSCWPGSVWSTRAC